jgi:hypothetical protein
MKNTSNKRKKETFEFDYKPQQNVGPSFKQIAVDDNAIVLVKLQNEVADYYRKIFERLSTISSL